MKASIRRALQAHHQDTAWRQYVRRLLGRVGSGQDLGHQRVRPEGLRVMDPLREEVRVEAAAEVRQHRRVLAKFRHARPLGRELGGVGVAGRAVQLGEKQATFAQCPRFGAHESADSDALIDRNACSLSFSHMDASCRDRRAAGRTMHVRWE